MEYASKVMNPINKILEKLTENCTNSPHVPPPPRPFPTIVPLENPDNNEEPSLIIYPFGIHHRTTPSNSGHLPNYSNPFGPPSSSLCPPPTPTSTQGVANHEFLDLLWGPQSTFWMTLIFLTFLGLSMTTCCILKQRYDTTESLLVATSPRNPRRNPGKHSKRNNVATINLPLENLVTATSTEVEISREIPTTTSCIFSESPTQVVLGMGAVAAAATASASVLEANAGESSPKNGSSSTGCSHAPGQIIQHV